MRSALDQGVYLPLLSFQSDLKHQPHAIMQILLTFLGFQMSISRTRWRACADFAGLEPTAF